MTLPAGVLFNPRWQARDDSDLPMPGAKLYSWATGGAFSTPQFLYTDVDLTTPHTNPVVADANGYFAEMFMIHEGYDLQLKTTAGVLVRTAINVEDIGAAFLSGLGTYLAAGDRDVVSGYTVLADDLLITVDSGPSPDPCIINLPSVADRTEQIAIMNVGTVDVDVTPDGAEMTNFQAGGTAFTIPAGTSPNWPVAVFLPSADDNGWILVSGAFLT